MGERYVVSLTFLTGTLHVPSLRVRDEVLAGRLRVAVRGTSPDTMIFNEADARNLFFDQFAVFDVDQRTAKATRGQTNSDNFLVGLGSGVIAAALTGITKPLLDLAREVRDEMEGIDKPTSAETDGSQSPAKPSIQARMPPEHRGPIAPRPAMRWPFDTHSEDGTWDREGLHGIAFAAGARAGLVVAACDGSLTLEGSQLASGVIRHVSGRSYWRCIYQGPVDWTHRVDVVRRADFIGYLPPGKSVVFYIQYGVDDRDYQTVDAVEHIQNSYRLEQLGKR